VIELLVLGSGLVLIGALRPRWTSLIAAAIPQALAFAWLLLQKDVPWETTGLADIAWFVVMSSVVGAAAAGAIAAGVLLRRAVSGVIGRRVAQSGSAPG
jgi:hypothetical protein